MDDILKGILIAELEKENFSTEALSPESIKFITENPTLFFKRSFRFLKDYQNIKQMLVRKNHLDTEIPKTSGELVLQRNPYAAKRYGDFKVEGSSPLTEKQDVDAYYLDGKPNVSVTDVFDMIPGDLFQKSLTWAQLDGFIEKNRRRFYYECGITPFFIVRSIDTETNNVVFHIASVGNDASANILPYKENGLEILNFGNSLFFICGK